MTLSELLHSVSFDDLIPTLKEVYGVETDIYAYREAFDELNLLLPRKGTGIPEHLRQAMCCLTKTWPCLLAESSILQNTFSAITNPEGCA